MLKDMTPIRALVLVGCAYEIVALLSPLPTITNVVHRAKEHSLPTRALVWLGAGAAVWHFFVEPEA